MVERGRNREKERCGRKRGESNGVGSRGVGTGGGELGKKGEKPKTSLHFLGRGSSESACCLTVLGRARFLLAMCIAQSGWKERQLQHSADAVRVM